MFVCEGVSDRNQTLGLILRKFCSHVLGRKITEEFISGLDSLTVSKWQTILRTICLEQLILFENQSHETKSN